MKKAILFLILGLLGGSVAAAYFLGVSRKGSLPGVPVRAPDRSGDTSGTVSVVIEEKFFDSLLGTIFTQLGPPQLKLAQGGSNSLMKPAVFQGGCENVLVLNQESNNVKTGVRFTAGRITAPLAFTGSYSVLTRCVQFKGTATATVDLSFDQDKQTVFGRLNADEVTLDGVSPIVSALVTAFVRRTIDERLNPFEVLRVSQLALSLPIKASGGSVRAQIKDVRSEVQEGTLRLYLTYDFVAQRGG